MSILSKTGCYETRKEPSGDVRHYRLRDDFCLASIRGAVSWFLWTASTRNIGVALHDDARRSVGKPSLDELHSVLEPCTCSCFDRHRLWTIVSRKEAQSHLPSKISCHFTRLYEGFRVHHGQFRAEMLSQSRYCTWQICWETAGSTSESRETSAKHLMRQRTGHHTLPFRVWTTADLIHGHAKLLFSRTILRGGCFTYARATFQHESVLDYHIEVVCVAGPWQVQLPCARSSFHVRTYLSRTCGSILCNAWPSALGTLSLRIVRFATFSNVSPGESPASR